MLASLSNAALLLLAERDDLTPAMKVVIADELRARREALEAARDEADRRAALAAYYAESVGGSVLADYRAGNVTTIFAG